MMIEFEATLLKFNDKGEKTGWTYIYIPEDVIEELNPSDRKSFRIKGSIDDYKIKSVALIPMGRGKYIMPVNSAMRKATGKRHGAMVKLKMMRDTSIQKINADLMACLEEEKEALDYFNSLAPSHRNYYSKWIDSAKTIETKTARIARCMEALSKKMNYGQMLQAERKTENR